VVVADIYTAHDQPYSSGNAAKQLRSDGTVPPGAVGTTSSQLAHLGTGNGDFIYWSNGDTSFAAVQKNISGTDYAPISADFDNDGYDDIIWYNPLTGTANIWWSRGDGTFTSQNNYALGSGLTLVAGDFDGQNGADFLVCSSGGCGVQWSNGNRTFTGASSN